MENTPNEQNINQQFNQQFSGAQGGQTNVPNAVAVLVLGICSIFPGCFCAGLVGLICGIIALVMAKKGTAAYTANPGAYTPASYNNLKAGKICAIIGLSLSALILIIYVIYFVIIGAAFSALPWGKF